MKGLRVRCAAMFAAWGRFVYRHRRPVLAASLLFLAVFAATGFIFAGKTNDEATRKYESVRASDLITAEIRQQQGTSGATFIVVFRSTQRTLDDPAFRASMDRALSALRGDPRVTAVQTPFDVKPEAARALESRDGHEAMVTVTTRDPFLKARDYYPQLAGEVVKTDLQYWLTGNLAVSSEFDSYLSSDLQRAEYVSVPVSFLLLFLVFATVVAALLPIGVGAAAVLTGIAGTLLLARLTNVSQYSLNIVTLIGLGVAIDYSLLIVNRFREELEHGAEVGAAVETTMATAGRAVTFSGLTVAIGLGGMLFFPGTFLVSMGIAGSIVVAMAIIFAATFLPALLGMLGPRVNRLRIPMPGARGGFWRRLAAGVMRRPLLVLVPCLALALLAATPLAGIRIANGDQHMLPPQSASRKGLEQLSGNFPGQDQNTFVLVVHYLDGGGLDAQRIAGLRDYEERVATYPNVIRVDSVVSLDSSLTTAQYQQMLAAGPDRLPAGAQQLYRSTVGKDIVVLLVRTDRPTQSDAAFSLLSRLRSTPAPPGSEALVSGGTAFNRDFISLIQTDMPAAVLFVVVVTYAVLFLLVGSVLLPLKAVITNLLSISASFGAMVWVFQQGHLSGLLNFTPQPIDPILLVLLFCIVFGLSMDYEVMLLSRIHEEWQRTGDNLHAVAEGLERSGRLITGAAAIMVAVFLSFGLAQVLLIKAIGIGLALAVFIDATLMRMLIVPAVMRILGRLNWWAPRPLALLHRRLGLADNAPPVRRLPEAAV